jgi:hypothetical protein
VLSSRQSRSARRPSLTLHLPTPRPHPHPPQCTGPLASACVAPSFCSRDTTTGVEVCNCLSGFYASDNCATSIATTAGASWLGLRFALLALWACTIIVEVVIGVIAVRASRGITLAKVLIAVVLAASVLRVVALAYDPFFFNRVGGSAVAVYVIDGLVFPLLVTAYTLVMQNWLVNYRAMHVNMKDGGGLASLIVRVCRPATMRLFSLAVFVVLIALSIATDVLAALNADSTTVRASAGLTIAQIVIFAVIVAIVITLGLS